MRFLLVLTLMLAAAWMPAHAQVARLIAAEVAATKPAAAPAPAAAPTTALTPEQAQQALDVLKDDAKRAQIVTVLEAIAKAGPAAAAPAGEPKLPIPLAPDSLGAQIANDAIDTISHAADEVVAAVKAVTDFPLIWRFLVHLVTDPETRGELIDAGWKLLVVVGAGLAVEQGMLRLLRRPLAAVVRLAPAHALPAPTDDDDAFADGEAARVAHRPPWRAQLRRAAVAALHFLLGMAPVLAMLAVSFALARSRLGAEPVTHAVILSVLQGYVLYRVAMSAATILVEPDHPNLRLLTVTPATAQYVVRWVRRIMLIAVVGSTLADIGVAFGMYRLAHDAILKLVALVVDLCLVVIILECNGAVAAVIRAKPGASGTVAMFRNRLAAAWPVLAIFYLLALWTVWALEVSDGFARLLRTFLLTVAVLAVARVLTMLALRVTDRALTVPPDIASRFPGLDVRMANYHPLARAGMKTLMLALTIVALCEAWGLDAIGWFTGGALGVRLVSSLGTIGVTVVVAFAVWEMSNAAIQRHLARLSREAQVARSARLRTLMPMVRTTLLGAILLVVGLMVLSEVGVNIAPLLAGAGVIGLAIGFGSQKLVQDIITGLFLLLENTMQVGDVVTLGGMSGSVENLSIRTIRLRSLDGSVHIVPFSAVTTVTNMTRDFGYAVLDVQVGLNEEPDGVADILREISAEMRQEPRWDSAMLGDIEVLGVDKFLTNAYVIRARIKTPPDQRWAVGREMNRRIKYRFDEKAIESPMTSYRALNQEPPSFVQITNDAPV